MGSNNNIRGSNSDIREDESDQNSAELDFIQRALSDQKSPVDLKSFWKPRERSNTIGTSSSVRETLLRARTNAKRKAMLTKKDALSSDESLYNSKDSVDSIKEELFEFDDEFKHKTKVRERSNTISGISTRV